MKAWLLTTFPLVLFINSTSYYRFAMDSSEMGFRRRGHQRS